MYVRVSSHRGKATGPGLHARHVRAAMFQTRRFAGVSAWEVVSGESVREFGRAAHFARHVLPRDSGRLVGQRQAAAAPDRDRSMPRDRGGHARRPGRPGLGPACELDGDMARLTAASVRQDAMASANSTTSRRTGQRSAPDILQASAQHFGQGVLQAFVAGARNRR